MLAPFLLFSHTVFLLSSSSFPFLSRKVLTFSLATALPEFVLSHRPERRGSRAGRATDGSNKKQERKEEKRKETKEEERRVK
mmetsp:Transcript_54236/g.106109  ORF Transcript_54236/g.106109 Transcript_54236/m.106109 type:complete len:82 (-) Transcript_54236:962-1207(-)